MTLTLHAVREPDDARLAQAQVDEGDVRATIDLVAGQVRGVMLESAADGPPREVRPAEVWRLFDDTVAFWQSWLGQSTYRGRWREVVNRSAITLKLMTYAPTGGLVAAPTAALPEQVGGERNWDYRYTWVRDASFSVGALLGIGFVEEAEQFGALVGRSDPRAGRRRRAGRSTSCTGSTGRATSRRRCSSTGRATAARAPVRIGNGAADQLQLDIYGEAMDSIFAGHRGGLQVPDRGWTGDQQRAGLGRGELGPARGGHLGDPRRAPGVHLRAADELGALDRGVRMATTMAAPPRWRTGGGNGTGSTGRSWTGAGTRSARRSCSTTTPTSWTPRCCACPRSGSSHPGTRCGWPPWTPWTTSWSPTASSTATTRRPHRTGCRARRARSRCAPSPTSTRSPAPAGSTQARQAFEKMLTYANHLGLYSEEIALTGEQIGNFPQAFTHLSLIDAAVTLDAALDQRR